MPTPCRARGIRSQPRYRNTKSPPPWHSPRFGASAAQACGRASACLVQGQGQHPALLALARSCFLITYGSGPGARAIQKTCSTIETRWSRSGGEQQQTHNREGDGRTQAPRAVLRRRRMSPACLFAMCTVLIWTMGSELYAVRFHKYTFFACGECRTRSRFHTSRPISNGRAKSSSSDCLSPYTAHTQPNYDTTT